MTLPIPNLDDRRFQDLVDEAKERIPQYCPEWTDHNVSDPGVTLIELFASMVETLIFRLNRVSEKSYISFMQLMGVRLQPPTAARTTLTFWLSAALRSTQVIPADTEVSTDPAGGGETLTFSTDRNLALVPAELIACLTQTVNELGTYSNCSDVLRDDNQEAFLAFASQPQPGDAFYLGFSGDLSGHILELTIRMPIAGIGINPNDPPLAWEALCGGSWVAAERERDETGGLNRDGRVVLHLPFAMTAAPLGAFGHQGYWLRCRYTQPRQGPPPQPGYTASPQIIALGAATLGGSVPATHGVTISREILGRSTGQPGQSFRLQYTPVLPLRDDEQIETEEPSGDRLTWRPAPEGHFGRSRPGDQHFVLDSVTGTVSFGPQVREPDGHPRQYGAIPPRGALVRISHYRAGGGIIGNVGPNKLVILKSAVPNVDRVTNRVEASGGVDAERIERAMLRAPQMLRTSSRAVTAEDFEYLACEADPRIRRARCIQPLATDGNRPAPVRLLLVPAVRGDEGPIRVEQLRLDEELVGVVRAYIDQRRLLTTVVEYSQPNFIVVSAVVNVRVLASADAEAVRAAVEARLYRYLNPLAGGPDGTGWPFGRDLTGSEVAARLLEVRGVDYVRRILFQVAGARGSDTVAVPPDGLIVSGSHQVIVER